MMKSFYRYAFFYLALSLASPLAAEEPTVIYALKYGEFNSFPNYGVYWMGNPRFSSDQSVTPVYMYFWLIQTEEQNILVDTGTGSDFADRYAPYVSPLELLDRLNLAATDIDTVIISHPHFDHVDGLSLFPKAEVYIQREAYRFLTEDAPASAFIRTSGFPREQDALTLAKLAWSGRLHLLDGDTELYPNVKVIQVDGHHPGHQITVVQTSSQPVILASDAVHQYVNLESNIPMGLFQGEFKDVTGALDSIRALDGVVVAGHDIDVMQRFPEVHNGVVQIYPSRSN